MQTTIELIKTPQFWVGTIIAGILVNILSHWLVQKFPDIVSRISKRIATSTTKARAARKQRIEQMTNNIQLQQFTLSLSTNKKISGAIRGMCGVVGVYLSVFSYYKLKDVIAHNESLLEVSKYSLSLFFYGSITFIASVSSMKLLNDASIMVSEVIEARQNQINSEKQ